MAVRHVHGPNASHPVGSYGDAATTPVSRRTRSTTDPPGPELPRSCSCSLLRGQIHAISRCSADDKRVLPSSAPSAHGRSLPCAPSSPSASPFTPTPTSIRPGRSYGRQHRLPGEQPTHERVDHLQTDLAARAQSCSFGRVERLRLRRDAATSSASRRKRTADTRQDHPATYHPSNPSDQTADRNQHRWSAHQHPSDQRIRREELVQRHRLHADQDRTTETFPAVQERYTRESVRVIGNRAKLVNFDRIRETDKKKMVRDLVFSILLEN